MQIRSVDIRETGTAGRRKWSSTAGLTSGYQMTNITTADAAVAETTGGWMLVKVLHLPWNPQPVDQHHVDENVSEPKSPDLAQCYREVGPENQVLAEEFLPLGLETWPAWEA
jgi:hypothetical protein